jgi:hypothetical protein
MHLKTYLLASLLLLGACKKEEPHAPSKTELLTAKKWRLGAHRTTTATNGVLTLADNYAAIPACSLDDSFQFRTDNTFLLDEGTYSCAVPYAQTRLGSWEFVANETVLAYNQYTPGAPYLPFDLVELSATILHVRRTEKQYASPDPNQNYVQYDYIYMAL